MFATFGYVGIYEPLTQSVYSPPAAWWNDIDFGSPTPSTPDEEEGTRGVDGVYIGGRVLYENGTYPVGEVIRIFATDELIEEYVEIREEGKFVSNKLYKTGQLIKITHNGKMLETDFENPVFISYNAPDGVIYDAGTFYIKE